MVSESSVNKERKAGGAAAFVNTVILNKKQTKKGETRQQH